MGFVDFRKSRNTLFEGPVRIRGILIGKNLPVQERSRAWVVERMKKNPEGKWEVANTLGFFGGRKDNKGVYARSDIEAICSKVDDPAPEMVMA
jgi:hypothetical protein